MSALKVGDTIPDFKTIDSEGLEFDIRSVFATKKWLVLYFYPKDYTPGCTAQACSLRDEYPNLSALDAEVVGVSSDSIVSHKRFAKSYNLPFRLLSDDDKKLRNLFGVPTHLMGLLPGRVTYIIDKDLKIRCYINSINWKNHSSQVNDFFKIQTAFNK